MYLSKNIKLLLAATLAAFTAGAQNKWELKKTGDGIRIYTKSVASSGIKALKVEMETKGNVKQLGQLLLDIGRQKDWVYSTKSSSLVKRISANEAIYYTEKILPWPMTNRDVVIQMNLTMDTVAGTLSMHAHSVQHATVPEKKGLVRVPISDVTWKVKTVDAGTIWIEYEAQADPGGTVPAWVINMFLTKGPHETFLKLRKLLAG